MVSELILHIQKSTHLQKLVSITEKITDQMTVLRQQIMATVDTWRVLLHTVAPRQIRIIHEYAQMLIWIIPLVSRAAWFPATLLGDGTQVQPLMDELRVLQHAYDPEDDDSQRPRVVTKVYETAVSLLLHYWIKVVRQHVGVCIKLQQYFELAKQHATTTMSTFEMAMIMPIFEPFKDWRSLDFAYKTDDL